MNLATILMMAAAADGERVMIGGRADGLTFDALARRAAAAAHELQAAGADHLIFLDVNGPAWPISIFGAAAGGIPAVPLNYRLARERLVSLARRVENPFVVVGERYIETLDGLDAVSMVTTEAWLARLEGGSDDAELALDSENDEDPAVILFTSGTTSEPKGVILRHSHLSAYVIQTVEFGAAGPEDAALVSVPAYHVAGVGTVLTNTFAGRRLNYLADFTPAGWLNLVREEGITQAMLVPTMLARIVDELDGAEAKVPTLRSIAYGGAAMPRGVLGRALTAFPDTDFVNSYGLTETSSTIAILGPEDHREALAAMSPKMAARLGSVGRPVPGIEVKIMSEDGLELPAGESGELWVRGPQVSAEYMGLGRAVDDDGWFPTRDLAYIDHDGYIFVLGRSDDTIIRGGENIAPAEIEDALREHPGVADAGVCGIPDESWGQRILAAVILRPGAHADADELREWTRSRLRGSRTPDDITILDELPYSALGKLVRRDLEAMVTSAS